VGKIKTSFHSCMMSFGSIKRKTKLRSIFA